METNPVQTQPTPSPTTPPQAPTSVAPTQRPPLVPPAQEPSPARNERNYGGIVRDVALAVLVPAVFMIALGTFQSMFPERLLSTTTPADLGMVFEDVTLTTSDGLKLAAWYVPSRDGNDSSAVMVLHGYPADKGDLLGRASFLVETHALLFVDFRYFGQSEGKYSTVGIREVEDALAGIAYLKGRGAEDVGIYGFSLGGAVALQALGRSDDVDAVVAEAPYASIRVIAQEPYKYLGPLKVPLAAVTAFIARVITGVDTDAVSPLAAARETTKPVLLVHSRADTVVPFTHAELLRSALARNERAQFLFFDDLAHGAPSSEFARDVNAFFAANLNHPAP